MIEAIFVTLTEHTSAITNDTLGPQKYPYHWKLLQGYTSMHRHGTKTTMIFLSAEIEKPLGCYFQDRSPYYQAAQCNQKTPILVSFT